MLSKSAFMRFLECSCHLWLLKQRSDLLPEKDAGQQRRFDEGNAVDILSRRLFPEGLEIEGFNEEGAANTAEAIKKGARILFQPTFMTKTITCRCDILVKTDDDVWDIYEVKSTTKPKEEHEWDLAFQRICLEAAGIRINRTFIVHLNNTYVKQGDIDTKQLFTVHDATADVEIVLALTRKQIERALAVLALPKKPGLDLLMACNNPGECDFLPCYWGEFSEEERYAIAASLPEPRLINFLERGLLKAEHFPPDILKGLKNLKLPSSEPQKPIITIDDTAMRGELGNLQYPLYFLDYETFSPAIPLFDGYRPYQCVIFQYSLHVIRAPGTEPEHYEFLADTCSDPAENLASSLASHIDPVGSVIVWYMGFEATRNTELGLLLSDYTEFFDSLNERIFDLMLIVKRGYYVDSRFEGSASIKQVLPVMVPELAYADLAIQEGGTASASWPELTNSETTPKRKSELKRDMLAYCCRDTIAMVAIYHKFLEACGLAMSAVSLKKELV